MAFLDETGLSYFWQQILVKFNSYIPSTRKINNKTLANDINLTASDIGALPDTYIPPNQTAQQVGADPAGTATSAVSQHNTDATSHNDLRLALQELSDRINVVLDSDDTTLDQMSEVVAYIKSNKSMIDAITTSKVSVADIVDNLTTNASNKPLSAAQGAVIKTLIDALHNDKLDAAELTNAVNTALAQAKASGEFDGADGAPGKDGADGQPGKDGTSPVVSVSAITGGHRITITDVNGTKTVDVMDGSDGKNGADGKPGADGIPGQDGQPGSDGVGIQSVVQTTTSTEDGGTNIVTVTKTDGTSSTFAVRNGRRGSVGPAGADGNPGADGSPGKDGADGKSAYQYAVDGGYTGTETEFAAKLAKEKFANPNALTFTGAVTGSYDGSAPLEVAIPSGGDAGKRVRHIATVSVTEGTTSYNVTVDSNGDALNLESVYILTNNFWSNNGSYVQVSINGRELTRAYGASGSPQSLALEKMGELQKFTNIPKPSNVGISFGDYYNGKSAVISVGFWASAAAVDTTIEIYGVDA